MSAPLVGICGGCVGLVYGNQPHSVNHVTGEVYHLRCDQFGRIPTCPECGDELHDDGLCHRCEGIGEWLLAVI